MKVTDVEVEAAIQAYGERSFYTADPLSMRAALEAAAKVREDSCGMVYAGGVVEEKAFASFWAKYPNKVGKDAARRSFAKVLKRGVDCDILMQGLARYCTKTDDRPWCNPATWLNQARWDDQPAEVVNGSDRKGNITTAINRLVDSGEVREDPPRLLEKW